MREIAVAARWLTRGVLALAYRIEGEMKRLRIPQPRAPRRGVELWRHTCCEAFIALGGRAQYHEFNFSPSGEWAAFAFRSYRESVIPAGDAPSPRISVWRAERAVGVDARLDLDRWITLEPGSLLRLGLSVVIEDSKGALSYWALRHPAAKPDFHHPESFALELRAPDREATCS